MSEEKQPREYWAIEDADGVVWEVLGSQKDAENHEVRCNSLPLRITQLAPVSQTRLATLREVMVMVDNMPWAADSKEMVRAIRSKLQAAMEEGK